MLWYGMVWYGMPEFSFYLSRSLCQGLVIHEAVTAANSDAVNQRAAEDHILNLKTFINQNYRYRLVLIKTSTFWNGFYTHIVHFSSKTKLSNFIKIKISANKAQK